MLSKENYKELLDLFPEVEFAFAYGSGYIDMQFMFLTPTIMKPNLKIIQT